jgi:hypothetical protein
MSDGMSKSQIRTLRCPICGEAFCPTPLWVWKDGRRYYCKYSCMRKGEKKDGRRKEARNREP